MNFGANFYVPILKAKRAEKKALQLIAPAIQAQLLPLLEIVERRTLPGGTASPLAKHIEKAFDGLPDAVASYPRCFLDCREIESDGPSAAAHVFAQAAALPIAFTSVTGITRTVDVDAAMSNRSDGVAIRLTREEFESGQIPSRLPAFLRKYSLTPQQTDLIVDLGAVDDMIAAGIEALSTAFLDDVPNREQWRTLTISACAFRKAWVA